MKIRPTLVIFLWSFTILALDANAQESLDQMIARLKRQNVVKFPNVNTQTLSNNAQAHLQSTGAAQRVDARFNPRLSNFISTKILQLAHTISLQFRDQPVKNLIVSPVSIASAMALVLLGAHGQTYQEIMHLFGFDQDSFLSDSSFKIHEEFGLLIEDLLSDSPSPNRPRPLNAWKYQMKSQPGRRQTPDNPIDPSLDHIISIANGIFIQNGFSLRPTYQQAVEEIYRSEIVQLDFRHDIAGSMKYINDWVKARTHGKIQQIVGNEVNSNTNMVIASTLYFKALWDQTFIDGATNKKNFYPNGVGTNPISVDMMAHGGEFPFYDAKEYDCRILGFPYKGNQTTMYIILPNNSSRNRLREIQSFLTPERIDDMISKMQLKTAIILFPKLQIQNSVDLKSIFMRLGVRDLFDQIRSDLSVISSGRTVTVGNLKPPSSGFVASHPVHTVPMDPNIPVFQPNNNQVSSLQQNLLPIRNDQESLSMNNLGNQLIFSRFGPADPSENMQSDQPEEESTTNEQTTTDKSSDMSTESRRRKRAVSYKVESSYRKDSSPLRYKDFVLSKRIVKQKDDKKLRRGRRQILDPSGSIKQLDLLRKSHSLVNPRIFADAIVHKIDLTVNERGTEGGAATAVYLTRTGTDVVFRVETPFLLLIQHDATRIPLFYGPVYEPTS